MQKVRRISKRTGLSFFIKITGVDGLVTSCSTGKKLKASRFMNLIPANFRSVYIKVTYKEGLINEGLYTMKDKHEILNAWQSFTAEDLIKEALEY